MSVFLTLAAAALTAAVVDVVMSRRGWLPPGFRLQPWRRWVGAGLLALVFWIGMFATLGLEPPSELPESIPIPSLFQMHALLLLALVGWWALGFAGVDASESRFGRQFGLNDPRPWFEVAFGGLASVVAWLVAIAAMVVAVGIAAASGLDRVIPSGPPEVVVLLASLPFLARLALALSAGVFEELFFRGFLQPRIGIGLSTALFVFAHASYGQPMMLVGVTVLSLIFAWLAHFRQSIWAAAAAHAGFDAIQLLIVLPLATRFAGA